MDILQWLLVTFVGLQEPHHPPPPQGLQMDLAICAIAVEEAVGAYGNRHPQDYEGRLRTCLEVHAIGVMHDVDPLLMVSLSYEETALVPQPRTSSKGAQGPFQVMPHHNCPGRTADGCDLGFAAVLVLRKYGLRYGCGPEAAAAANDAIWNGWESFQQHAGTTRLCDDPDWVEVLCHYNSGEKCYSSSRSYAKRVIRRWKRLEETQNLLLQHATQLPIGATSNEEGPYVQQ